MFILLIHSALSLGCYDKLESFLDSNLKPKILTFNQTGDGLDWIDSFHECKISENPYYGAVLWKKHHLTLTTYAFCIPQECGSTEVEPAVLQYLNKDKLGEKVSSHTFEVKVFSLKSEGGLPFTAKPFFYSFLLLIAITAVSTVLSPFLSSENPFHSFSVIKNAQMLFTLQNNFGDLQFIDGIRAIGSISLLIFHCFILQVLSPMKDRSEYNKVFNSFSFTLINSLTLYVDVFFIIAGFLMSYMTISEMQKKKENFSWALFFIRRVIRYLPLYLFLIGFERLGSNTVPGNSQMLIMHVGGLEVVGTWWTSLLFMHNFMTEYTPNYLLWTWTVAADMQFYVICSISLYAYNKSKSLGYFTAFSILIMSIAYSGIIANIYGLSPSTVYTMLSFKQFNLVYIRPLPRIGVYTIGLILGFLYLAYKSKNKGVSFAYELKDNIAERFESKCFDCGNNQLIRVDLYKIGVLLIGFSIFGPYYLDAFGEESLSQVVKSVWLAFQRPLFAVGVCCWLLPLLLGHSSWLMLFLQMKIFRFLSKVSYAVYMIHCVILTILFMSGDDLGEFSYYRWVMKSAILSVISVIVAAILHVLIESPFLSLERKYIAR